MKLARFGLALAAFASGGMALVPTLSNQAQSNPPPSTAPLPGSTDNAAAKIIRDPMTGRTYRQELVTVSVPTTTWESKPVTQTVYEPTYVTRYVTTQNVVYVPQQSYVLQQRVRGRLNPFRQPYYVYRYRPVTQWVASLQTQQTPVTSTQWVARQQTNYVPQAVQKNVVQQQLVTTEIPSALPGVVIAAQPAPRLRIPLLARQRPLLAAPPLLAANTTVVPAYSRTAVGSGLRPIAAAAAYSAPLRTAAISGYSTRDPVQSGMAATVLR